MRKLSHGPIWRPTHRRASRFGYIPAMPNVRSVMMSLSMVVLGCASKPPTPATPANQPAAASTPAATDAPPANSKFKCHLDCSGKEVHAYGPTQEEATANARKLVADTCNPDDGQHFIVCDPVTTAP